MENEESRKEAIGSKKELGHELGTKTANGVRIGRTCVMDGTVMSVS